LIDSPNFKINAKCYKIRIISIQPQYKDAGSTHIQRLSTQIKSAHVQVPLHWPLSSNSPRQNGEEIKFMSQTLLFFHWKSLLWQAIQESTASLFTMNSTGTHTYSLVYACVCE